MAEITVTLTVQEARALWLAHDYILSDEEGGYGPCTSAKAKLYEALKAEGEFLTPIGADGLSNG